MTRLKGICRVCLTVQPLRKNGWVMLHPAPGSTFARMRPDCQGSRRPPLLEVTTEVTDEQN